MLMDGDEGEGYEIVMYELAACASKPSERERTGQRGGRQGKTRPVENLNAECGGANADCPKF